MSGDQAAASLPRQAYQMEIVAEIRGAQRELENLDRLLAEIHETLGRGEVPRGGIGVHLVKDAMDVADRLIRLSTLVDVGPLVGG